MLVLGDVKVCGGEGKGVVRVCGCGVEKKGVCWC